LVIGTGNVNGIMRFQQNRPIPLQITRDGAKESQNQRPLKSSDPVKSGISREAADFVKGCQGPVCVDSESAHFTGSGIERVEEFAVSCDSKIQVRAARWERSDDGSVDRREFSMSI